MNIAKLEYVNWKPIQIKKQRRKVYPNDNIYSISFYS